MSTQPGRSEQVISDYKQRKVARSALRRIQDLLHQFEAEREFDRRAAGIGVIALLILLGAAFFFLFSGNSITLN